jgi:Flp pilus assembly protein TadG
MHLTGRPMLLLRRRSVARRRSGRPAEGQALVEFALVATPLLMLLFGIIQLGLLFGSQEGLNNATRDEARYASTVLTTSGTDSGTNASTACGDLMTRLAQYVPAFSTSNLATSGNRTRIGYYYYAVPNQSPARYSVRVIVEVQYRQLLLLPIVGQLLDGFDGATDNRLRLGSREEMRVEGSLAQDAPTGLGLNAPSSWTTC